MRPCQLSNARLVCVLAAPTAWLNGSGADTVQLAGHLLDLFLLLGWPRGNPVQTSSQEEANEDTAGYNEPLCQLLQVLFTAISERRLPPSLRRLAWPARRQTSGQARDADRLLADFVSGSSPGCPDFTGHACILGGSLADSGSRVASVGCLSHGRQHRRLGHACWLFELLHRHFTVYPAGRRRLRVVWLPVHLDAFPDEEAASHLRSRPVHLLSVANGNLSVCLLYAGLTNLTGLPQTLLEAAESFLLDCLPARLPHLFHWRSQQASANGASAAIEIALADPADYLTVVNAKSGSGGGILSRRIKGRRRIEGRRRLKGGGGSRAGSLGRAASLTSLNNAAGGTIDGGSAGDLSGGSGQQQAAAQWLQQAGGAGVFAYLLLDWPAGVCHASQAALPQGRLAGPELRDLLAR
uniref:RNase H domain-containing protein n=1 Tax=Macrostomum lignano TaxID=282301 RepID=A0A1I8J1V2_9PLAT